MGILTANGLHAQNEQRFSLSGQVQSTHGCPLPGAHVKLTGRHADGQWYGMAADSVGRFSLLLPSGTYQLEISFVGYATHAATVEIKEEVRLPLIRLQEESKMMEEVVVTARTVTYHSKGYVADIAANPRFRNKHLDEVLNALPGISVSEQKGLQVYGEGVREVYLNGHKLRMNGTELSNYLKTLDARQVKQVEVVSDSGVEEAAASMGGSIIRITAPNPETGGRLNLSARNLTGRNQHTYGLTAATQVRLSKAWGAYFRGGTFDGWRRDGSRTVTTFHETGEQRVYESTGKRNTRHNYNFNGGFTFDPDARNLFALDASYNTNKASVPHHHTTVQWLEGTCLPVASGGMDKERTYQRANFSLSYTRKLEDNGRLDVKAGYLLNTVDDDEYQRFDYTDSDRLQHNQLTFERNRAFNFRTDYKRPLDFLNSTFTAGISYLRLHNEDDTDYVLLHNDERDNRRSYTDLYSYREEVMAAYADYAFKMKRFSFSLGLRIEHSDISPRSSTNPERNQDNRYTDFFPGANLSYSLNKEKGHNLRLAYNRTISRPRMSELNPLVRRLSEYSYTTGNPLLEASYGHHLTLTSTWFDQYILRIKYSRYRNGTVSVVENREGSIWNSYQNGNKGKWLSVYAEVPVTLGNWGNLRLSAYYRHANNHFQAHRNSSNNWLLQASGNFRLPGNITFSASCAHNFYSRGLYTKQLSRPNVDCSLNKSFPRSGWRAGLTFMDLFNSWNCGSESFNHDFYQRTGSTTHNFIVALTLNYTLRWGQKSNVRQSVSDSPGSQRIETQ